MSSLENRVAKLSVRDDQGGALGDVTAERVNTLAPTWKAIKPVEYDYSVYNASGPEEREAAERGITERLAAEAQAASEADQYTSSVPLWASGAAKYEWQEDYGDIGPPHPELEKQLFKDQFINRIGPQFNVLAEIKVAIDSESMIDPVASFDDAGLHPVMLENIKLCGYRVPTPIQAYCLPAVLTNHDVIAVAQTGSGKTAAYLIPTLSKLMGKAKKLAAPRPNIAMSDFQPMIHGVRAEPLILVICPTRELSAQIFDEARRLCYRSMLRPCVAYGGGPTREQADELRKGCDVLIGTPGRLMDFMSRGNLVSLSRVKYTIIDEADELVGPDWEDDLKTLLSGGDNNEDADHRFMMFSATFPKKARELAREYLSDDHIRIRVGRAGSTHLNVKQNVIFVEDSKKRECLYDLLIATPPARTIIFVNSKKSADFLDDYLFNRGLPSTSIHSDRTQREREDALRAFKSGKAPVLVATGVSARGLDIINVMHVINFDLPNSDYGGIHEYVHRIGRTARIGNDGVATSFYNDRNEDIAEALVKVLLESKQTVPEFLEQFKPEGDKLDFDDDTGSETSEDDTSGGNGWGASSPNVMSPAAPEGNTWNADTSSGDAQADTSNMAW